jgi:hypothetical protein
MNRRDFLTKGTAATLAAISVPAWLSATELAANKRIRIVYSLHSAKQTGPDWPNKGFDFGPVMEQINATLAKECPGMQFVASLATGEEQAKQILDQDKSGHIDGYLVYQMNCWNRVVQTLATSGKPVLYADFQYGGSGGFLTYMADFLRKKASNVGFVASSKPQDLVAAVKCFESSPSDFAVATTRVRLAATPKTSNLKGKPDTLKTLATDECIKRMKASKILAIRGQESGPAAPLMGIPVENVPFAELNEAWKLADKDESRAMADYWAKTATEVTEVTPETLQTCAAMYLAQKAVMKKHGANAITINCLGGFYGGHIHAYPCLGFHQLLNEGLVGACECDVRSTATMVAMTTLTQGRPGYISDPVIDTSKRQIIYAHCVASNRPFGPQGQPNGFQILTHSEDRQGASVRSFLPVGYITTTLEISPERKEILFHQGKTMANVPDDRACRTKLAAEPIGDLEKLFTQWDQWGWHRVTFYGDFKEPVYALADALGWKVVVEA